MVIDHDVESVKNHLKQTQEFGALKNPMVFDIETHEFPTAGSILGGEKLRNLLILSHSGVKCDQFQYCVRFV